MKADSVFEKYAHEYDLMTNATAREGNHAREVDAIIARTKPSTVLDAGCATGLTASLFARRGVPAVGLDRSGKMLDEARRKFSDTDLALEFRRGEFEKLPKSFQGRFDLVVCLANSISGVGTRSGLKQSISNFHQVLKPQGYLVLQALNIEAMDESRLNPIKASREGDVGYLRFARRVGNQLELTVVRLDFSTDPFGFEPFRHTSDSFAPDLIQSALEGAGFKPVRRFGNLLMSKRFSRNGRDVVFLARRPAR